MFVPATLFNAAAILFPGISFKIELEKGGSGLSGCSFTAFEQAGTILQRIIIRSHWNRKHRLNAQLLSDEYASQQLGLILNSYGIRQLSVFMY
jgi:hypothetical protein